MAKPIVAPRIEPRGRKLGLSIGLGVLGVVVGCWLLPSVTDRLIYGSVGRSCEKRMSLWGSDGEQRIFGRHCRIGSSTSQTESGFFLSFEYARDGQVLLWGAGELPRHADDEVAVSLALVRTPGDDGRWVCAGSGTWRTPDEGEHEVDLAQVGLLLDERGLAGDGSLTTGDGNVNGSIGGWSISAPIGGWGCSQSSDRCELSASEPAAVRVFVRTDDEGGLAHGFLLREDQRAARSVGLSVATGDSSSFERIDDGPNIGLSGLSALVQCPQQTPGTGTLKLRWTD